MKLYETYKEILSEANASISDIIKAIDERQLIDFFYEGDPKYNFTAGRRSGEVYALGTSKGGNKVVRIFQMQGATNSINPKFKLFRLDKMRDIKFIRPYYRPRKGFNPNGDRAMASVDKVVDF